MKPLICLSLAAGLTWLCLPHRWKAERYVFPTPLGSKAGYRVPGATLAEIAERVSRLELFV